MKTGCADCHSGKLLGGESLEKFGVYHEYWTATGSETRDAGLFESSSKEDDRYTLRTFNASQYRKDCPYFHDGSVATLSEAVRVRGQRFNSIENLIPSRSKSIVAFLGSLTGEVPANYSSPRLE